MLGREVKLCFSIGERLKERLTILARRTTSAIIVARNIEEAVRRPCRAAEAERPKTLKKFERSCPNDDGES